MPHTRLEGQHRPARQVLPLWQQTCPHTSDASRQHTPLMHCPLQHCPLHSTCPALQQMRFSKQVCPVRQHALAPHTFAGLQQMALLRHDCDDVQQLGPHTLLGVQQPPPGSTPPSSQSCPVIGSHCWLAAAQRRLVAEPHVRAFGQHAPLTQLLPDGLRHKASSNDGVR